MNPDALEAFARSVVADLDAAGPFADWLEENGNATAGRLLRRRWRMWRKERAGAADAFERFIMDTVPWLIAASYDSPKMMRESAERGTDDAFRRYVRARFLTPSRVR